jgi:hypothetical protein
MNALIPFSDFATSAGRVRRWHGALLILLLLSMPLVIALAPWLAEAWAVHAGLLAWALCFAALMLCAPAMLWVRWRTPAVHCPHCRSYLGYHARLILATGNCCACGRHILDAPACGVLRDFEEFRAASAHHTRRKLTAILLGIGGLGACLLLEVTLLSSGINDQDGLSNLSPSMRLAVRIAKLAPVVFGFSFFFLVVLRAWRQSETDQRLQCPACRQALFKSHLIVIATRRCTKCQRRILSEPAA